MPEGSCSSNNLQYKGVDLMGTARIVPFLLSSIGSGSIKSLTADYNPQVPLMVTRATIKVRSLGTNTYIAIGNYSDGQPFRLTGVGDSKTYQAPMKNGSEVPFDLTAFRATGDNAANDGVLEIDAQAVD